MSVKSTLAAGAAIMIGLAFSLPAAAQSPQAGSTKGPSGHVAAPARPMGAPRPTFGGYHGGAMPGGTSTGHIGTSPPGSFHGEMPPHGFHAAPNGFRGTLPHAPHTSSAARFVPGPGHDIGRFHGRDFAHLTPAERSWWRHGGWHHSWHNGHWGWWWVASGSWYFYPEPIYPYPDYIGSDVYYDYYGEYGTPDYYWYWCDNPRGYYPYVQVCYGPWQPVPPNP